MDSMTWIPAVPVAAPHGSAHVPSLGGRCSSWQAREGWKSLLRPKGLLVELYFQFKCKTSGPDIWIRNLSFLKQVSGLL